MGSEADFGDITHCSLISSMNMVTKRHKNCTWKTRKFLALIRMPSFSSSSLYSESPTTLLLMRYSEEEPENTCKAMILQTVMIWGGGVVVK